MQQCFPSPVVRAGGIAEFTFVLQYSSLKETSKHKNDVTLTIEDVKSGTAG